MFRCFRCIASALMVLFALGIASSANAQVYNLAADWSDVNNPNGVWRLFEAPGQLFTINQPDWNSNGSNQRAWADQPFQQTAHVPVWMKVSTASDIFIDTGTVLMHGAESGRTGTEFSSVTWISPFAAPVNKNSRMRRVFSGSAEMGSGN